jgi:hypothetical protein
MVTICKWIPLAPTDCAEIPGAYKRACLPVNSAAARTARQVGLLSRSGISVFTWILQRGELSTREIPGASLCSHDKEYCWRLSCLPGFALRPDKPAPRRAISQNAAGRDGLTLTTEELNSWRSRLLMRSRVEESLVGSEITSRRAGSCPNRPQNLSDRPFSVRAAVIVVSTPEARHER